MALAQPLSDAHFPDTLHADILLAVGIDDGRVSTQVTWRKRDPAFRRDILRAYHCRCAVCGFDLRMDDQPAGWVLHT